MINSHLIKILALFMLFFPVLAKAGISEWQIVPLKSSLTFTATQNGSPVRGKFTRFSGNIKFDPDLLEQSSVMITVETASVSASYKDLVDTLKTADWFNVALFPQAIFKASQFTKTGDQSYLAKGNLTLRNKTLPVSIAFSIVKMSDSNVTVKGSTVLKRNAFGIGQGEWSGTDEIKDEVKVEFILSVVKKNLGSSLDN